MTGSGGAEDAAAGGRAGLAHDLNQPLTATTLYLQAAVTVAERQPQSMPADVLDLMRKALKEAERAVAIAARLQESGTSLDDADR